MFPKPFPTKITVARPSLPPLDAYCEGLKEVWSKRWMTNHGPIHNRFQAKLAERLGTEVALFSNGALALESALASLGCCGEVITTPFTFPATSNAIRRCGAMPVFADVEPRFLTLDPERVEEALTPRTSAILAVHLYGNPADLQQLGMVADKYGIKLIYDAAHAFSTCIDGQSIARFGDVTMFSFHATKPFHSAEGGALTSSDADLLERCRIFANHGIAEDGFAATVGTNAKMSELHALMGELLLDGTEERRLANKALVERYRECLADLPGIRLLPQPPGSVEPSYAFFPILVEAGEFGMSSAELQSKLNAFNVETRRYFAPMLTELPAFADCRHSDGLSIARSAAERVLTLPIYPDMPREYVDRIAEMIAAIRRQR